MYLSSKVAKIFALMSLILIAFPMATLIVPAEAQQTSAQNPRLQGSIPLPAGVTANITVETLIFLSFRPNPVGVGQTVLVNIWFNHQHTTTDILQGSQLKLQNQMEPKTPRVI